MGRPRKPPQLTADQIELMASMGCSDDEIAAVAGLGERTLQDHFRTHLKKGRARLCERLRRRQIERADEGSEQMLIWLGKVYLGQRAHAEQTVHNVSHLTDVQLTAVVEARYGKIR